PLMADDKKPSGYLLDEASIVKLRMLSEDYDERNPEKRTERQFLEAQKAPDNYFALPPCGKSIPARVGNTLGSAECCIFKSVDGVL
ncbi:hypothetical protein, partial [Streptococcus pneumoniae]|uniref:hypothetical protein n=1 Tax=Streptococcus pneumoniae TaxID=1313 RepID=UPI001E4A8837